MEVAKGTLEVLTPFYAIGMGIREFVYNGLWLRKVAQKEKQRLSQSDRKTSYVAKEIIDYYTVSARFHIIGGAMTISLGLLNAARLFYRLINPMPLSVLSSVWSRVIDTLDLSFQVLIGNHMIKSYRMAQQINKKPLNYIERNVVIRAQQAAVVGVISSSCYIALAALCYLTTPTAIITSLAVIAGVTRFVNAYFEYLYVNPPTLPPNWIKS